MSQREPLPYLVHTNRELGLMLAGRKPLACFSDGYGHFPGAVLRYFRLFDRHVAAGRLIKREYVQLRGVDHIHVVLYALPQES